MRKERYCLRYAAGSYWLLDIQQSGERYIPPLQINEMGADVIRMLNNGASEEQITGTLCREYGAGWQQVSGDVTAFLQMLHRNGVDITDKKGTVMI